MSKEFKFFHESILELFKNGISFYTVTLTDVKGSAPQEIGARMITDLKGKILFGTVGGGKVENHILELVKNTNDIKKTHKTWNLQKDIGMTCGGEVSFFIERFNSTPQWNIVLFGAGHVSQALVPLLLNLDCQLTVVDERQEWLDKLPKNSALNAYCVSKFQDGVQYITKNSFVLTITKGHGFDVPVLTEVLKRSDIPYVGAIGSLSKRNAMIKELLVLGNTKSQIENLHCPIGEPFGNNTPIEISFSIIAELLKIRDKINL